MALAWRRSGEYAGPSTRGEQMERLLVYRHLGSGGDDDIGSLAFRLRGQEILQRLISWIEYNSIGILS